MACVSRPAETKSMAEGISAMTNKNDRVDDLLKHNVEQQLADFDWETLTKGVWKRLAAAEVLGSCGSKYGGPFKIAAAIAVATAVALTVLVIIMSRPPLTQLAETAGSALVEIKTISAKPHVTVDIGAQNRKSAKCDIEIIDAGESRRHQGTQTAWMIISRTERVYADDGFNNDMEDLICLF